MPSRLIRAALLAVALTLAGLLILLPGACAAIGGE